MANDGRTKNEKKKCWKPICRTFSGIWDTQVSGWTKAKTYRQKSKRRNYQFSNGISIDIKHCIWHHIHFDYSRFDRFRFVIFTIYITGFLVSSFSASIWRIVALQALNPTSGRVFLKFMHRYKCNEIKWFECCIKCELRNASVLPT